MSAPVDIAATYRKLGIMPDTRGYDVARLCSNEHGRTNIWARHKPVRHASVAPLTAEQLRAVNHGLVPPAMVYTANPLDSAWRRSLWAYAAPRGGTSEPFRLSDWEGYDPTAQPPAGAPGTLHLSPLDSTGSINFYFTPGGTSIVIIHSNLSLRDFAYIEDFYPCVVFSFKVDGVTYARYITAATTFGSGARSVAVPKSALRALPSEHITYFLCGASVPQTSLATPASARYVVLPSDRPLESEIYQSDSLPVVVNFVSVRAGGLGSSAFFGGRDVAEYNPMGSIQEFDPNAPVGSGSTVGSYKYLNVGRTATVSFKAAITNHGTSRLNIPATALYCRVVRNLAGATTPKVRVAELKIFNGGYMSNASSISINAGETAFYALSWPDYCCIWNDRGNTVSLPDTRRFNAGFQLLLNSNDSTTLGSVGINISNY